MATVPPGGSSTFSTGSVVLVSVLLVLAGWAGAGFRRR
jgi:hypothetical protein